MLSCEFCETVKNTIFTEHLETPASIFMEQNLMFYIYGTELKWLFQPFETPIEIEMYTCEIKIT